jgi:Domain of unknown function (DUF222)
MTQTPASRDPAPDGDPSGVPAGPGDHPWLGSADWRLVPQSPDWDEAYLAAIADDEDPGDSEEYQDPDNAPPPGLDDAELEALIAEAREITADQARAAEAAARAGHTAVLAAVGAVLAGRRGPGMPGSAETFPGECASPAAGFAAGEPLDVAPGCATLGLFAEDAAGDDDRYTGASDDELLGVICARDRAEAAMAAGKYAAVAELVRRRPAPGCALAGPAQMPEGWHEFTARELGAVLGIAAGDAEQILDLAWALEVCLPGTKAAFRAGIVNHEKAQLIAAATALLDPAEARAAEALVLDRAGSLTPAQLRAAIRRAVMEVNPEKARKRREHMARRTRVERWAEDSGNAGLAGRELPPAEVLAADQRVTAWAKELRKAGLEGDMDQLRARAYLDILLGTDSRPQGSGPDGTPGTGTPEAPDISSPAGTRGVPGTGPAATPAPAGPVAGVIPPGFAGRVTLTIPATTLLDLADRPGEMAGLGPIDPDLARNLAAAARNPRSTWCLTVTDSQGHAVGHGCARPAPAGRAKTGKPDTPGGPDPPREARFTFTPAVQPGPPGGYGTWRFSTGIPGQRDLLIQIGPIPARGCDHRHEARGHDPGVMLRHLAQVRHATCTGPGCRRPASSCDFEHNIPVRDGRPDLPVQRQPEVPLRSPAEARPPLERRAAPKRRRPLDHALRAAVHHRTHPLPHLTGARGTHQVVRSQSQTQPRLTVERRLNPADVAVRRGGMPVAAVPRADASPDVPGCVAVAEPGRVPVVAGAQVGHLRVRIQCG